MRGKRRGEGEGRQEEGRVPPAASSCAGEKSRESKKGEREEGEASRRSGRGGVGAREEELVRACVRSRRIRRS